MATLFIASFETQNQIINLDNISHISFDSQGIQFHFTEISRNKEYIYWPYPDKALFEKDKQRLIDLCVNKTA